MTLLSRLQSAVRRRAKWGSRWRRIRIYRGLRKWCRSSCRRGAMPTNRHRQTRRKDGAAHAATTTAATVKMDGIG